MVLQGEEMGVRENGHMTHQQHGGVSLGSDAGGGGDAKEKKKRRMEAISGYFSAVAPPAGHLRSKAISMC